MMIREEEHSVGSLELFEKPAEEEAWDLHDLIDVDRRGVSVLQSIHN